MSAGNDELMREMHAALSDVVELFENASPHICVCGEGMECHCDDSHAPTPELSQYGAELCERIQAILESAKGKM